MFENVMKRKLELIKTAWRHLIFRWKPNAFMYDGENEETLSVPKNFLLVWCWVQHLQVLKASWDEFYENLNPKTDKYGKNMNFFHCQTHRSHSLRTSPPSLIKYFYYPLCVLAFWFGSASFTFVCWLQIQDLIK